MSNYETAKKNAATYFLTFDMQKIIDRLSLNADAAYLYLDFVSKPHRINRKTGLCEYSENGINFQEADFNASLTLYDILCHSKEPIQMTGMFTPLNSLATVHNAASYAGKGAFSNSEKVFEQNTDAFRSACERLNGKIEGKGDASYRIPVFGPMDALLSFWNSDEDFPPSLKIYYDKNLTKYMHYETAWYLSNYIVGQIHRLMEV